MKFLRLFIFIIFSFVILFHVQAEDTVRRPRNKKAERWADSVYNCMNDYERIGQLFMVDVYANSDTAKQRVIDSLIAKYHIGGLIFMQGGPRRQAYLTNKYQQLSEIPLLIGMDAEWGLQMRLDSVLGFPKAMTLAALQNYKSIYEVGQEIAKQCKRLGVHINFAPVVDVNTNPANPVIGSRAFGDDKEQVFLRSQQYMRGLQSMGVLACAKHFPGHGNTSVDSHLGLPTINASKKQLEAEELYPFKKLIDDTLAATMVGHLNIPALDENNCATVSEKIVEKYLKNKLNFKGLIFTDALNMKAVEGKYAPGELELKAFAAGNDVLLFSQNIEKAFDKFADALKTKELDRDRLEESVKKILFQKYVLGLYKKPKIDTSNLIRDLNSRKAKALSEKLFRQSATLLKNADSLLPVKDIQNIKNACVLIGLEDVNNEIKNSFELYARTDFFKLSSKASISEIVVLQKKLESYDLVTVYLGKLNNQISANYGVSTETGMFVRQLNERKKMILAVLGNVYAANKFEYLKTIILSYEDQVVTRKLVPQMIFGGFCPQGKLPVDLHANLKRGTSAPSFQISRLSYVQQPEVKNMNSVRLAYIDSLVYKSISNKYMPGCQVLVIKDSAVVYNKSFGFHRYSTYTPVTDTSIYDIASLTKVSATLQATMQLYDQHKIDLTRPLVSYLNETSCTNKSNLYLTDILAHQAGLQAFLMHWSKTKTNEETSKYYYSKTKDSVHTIAVADSMFARFDLPDSMWTWTLKSNLLHKTDSCYHYKYSDIGFYIFQKINERMMQKSMLQFTDTFYNSLGMNRTGYLPLRKFGKNAIVPSAVDRVFRNRELWGYVNDEGAAMYGGVAGHAGIFSTANDLAKLFQMNLQGGYYGYKKYFNSDVIEYFRQRHFTHNRRGLGWDKPEWNSGGPTSNLASQKTFGHTGFTGTCAWVDPKYNLIYIFLSNRTYPDPENKGLIVHNIRTRIHDVIYESIEK
ncbi:MAG: glycoside hydrolase family 3 N-terminal domain-containing protein [Cytophagales bacterium]